MKNKIKKIAALVFALALMASTASTAFAHWSNGEGDGWEPGAPWPWTQGPDSEQQVIDSLIPTRS